MYPFIIFYNYKLLPDPFSGFYQIVMSHRHLLLLSNSTLHPTGYLEYAKDAIIQFLKENEVKKVN